MDPDSAATSANSDPPRNPRSGLGLELSWRALGLGALLSALLAAANAYLGLFAGMTISGSIPAAVVSMVVLRAVRGTLLENNIVQTSASAGESLAAGAIFTLPAFLFIGAWQEFDYLETVALLLAGGVLGTIFTIPLRRTLIEGSNLPFPEGAATARVLLAGHSGQGAKTLGLAAFLGAGLKLGESLVGVFASSATLALRLGAKPFVLSLSLSPALAAVGAIVGVFPSLLVALGGLFNWLLVIPFVADPTSPLGDGSWAAWSQKARFLGVGAMAVGGLLSTFEMRTQIREAFRTLTSAGGSNAGLDLSRRSIVWLGVLAWGLIGAVGFWTLGSALSAGVVATLAVGAAFLFSAVAAYMAGLVGSSNNPVSGITLATLLVVCTVLLGLGFRSSSPNGPAAALVVAGAICTALAIAGDTIQDLKAGHVLGALPKNQQIGQLVGVLAAALVLGPVLSLLLEAYGFGAVTPEHPAPLRAPQATLMAAVVRGFFGGDLPWGFVLPGAGLALGLYAVNRFRRAQRRREFPILAVAIGLYLPVEVSLTIFLGALAAHAWRQVAGGAGAPSSFSPSLSGLDEAEARREQAITLLGAGFISGEALAGLASAALLVSGMGVPWIQLGALKELLGLGALLGVLGMLRRGR
jgi:putative OPT family oligopeptide transporter